MSTTIDIDPAPPALAEDRTVAILSYLTILGFFVAVILHPNKKTRLGAYHLRQALGLWLAVIVFSLGGWMIAIFPVIGWLTLFVIWVSLFVVGISGLVAAHQWAGQAGFVGGRLLSAVVCEHLHLSCQPWPGDDAAALKFGRLFLRAAKPPVSACGAARGPKRRALS
jgi:hypothetical protein